MKLGDTVRCKLTAWQGVLVSKEERLYGSVVWKAQRQLLVRNGVTSPEAPVTFPDGQLEVVPWRTGGGFDIPS